MPSSDVNIDFVSDDIVTVFACIVTAGASVVGGDDDVDDDEDDVLSTIDSELAILRRLASVMKEMTEFMTKF